MIFLVIFTALQKKTNIQNISIGRFYNKLYYKKFSTIYFSYNLI